MGGPNPSSTITSSRFGALADGSEIRLYTLINKNGLRCGIINYGACVSHLRVPGRDGTLADIVLGYDTLEDYLRGTIYAGATIGRVANRIAGAGFTVDGRRHHVAANDGPNHLHGGRRGFDKVVWQAAAEPRETGASLRLTLTSPDGDEGYPGALTASVRYTLTDANTLELDYEALADRPTPVSLTNHAYFNLRGQGDILGHALTVQADHHTLLNAAHLPTGAITPVDAATDFRRPTVLGSRVSAAGLCPGGYNVNYVLSGSVHHAKQQPGFAARLRDPESGRTLELWTDQPGLQFYTGQFIPAAPAGKRGQIYGPYSGLCLEPQHFPDAVNQPGFPSPVLRPGVKYRQHTIWKFLVD